MGGPKPRKDMGTNTPKSPICLEYSGVSKGGVFVRGEISIIGVGARTGCNN